MKTLVSVKSRKQSGSYFIRKIKSGSIIWKQLCQA
jgi:hypothetical protein